jgi:hypothetical protein
VEGIRFWSQVREGFDVHLTQSIDNGLAFMCADLRPYVPFRLDRLWIAPTNQLAREINQRLHEWRAGSARDLGILKALTKLVTAIKSNPSLDEAHQIDFIETVDTPDLPLHILHFYEGDPCTLLRNISTLSGVVNGRRCWVLDAKDRVAVIRFERVKNSPYPYPDGKSVEWHQVFEVASSSQIDLYRNSASKPGNDIG